ncbi:MAG: 4Fe-4S cluster-binding domain-containing protein [Rickettsiales bacterium]|nr:4Fe-4S cluster-binding domain-containing protein [Rickettsiales bacterium]
MFGILKLRTSCIRAQLDAIQNMLISNRVDEAACMPNVVVRKLSVHLVDHCNLGCANCSHFCPLVKKDSFILSPDDFERDARRFSQLVDGRVQDIELYGGEPLLHPNVESIMEIARRNFPDSLIKIITNGILLPTMPESFWLAARKHQIVIEPTKYPIDVDWERIQKIAARYGVMFRFFANTGDVCKTMYHKPLDLNGLQDPRFSFFNCYHGMGGCAQLYQGKLYMCAIVAYVKYFNEYFGKDLKIHRDDFIDIHREGLSDRDIFEFLAKPIPFCRYCAIGQCTFGHKWRQSQKSISEWSLLP